MGFNPSLGATTCPNCGNQVPAGASFCPGCGRVVSATPPLSTAPAVPPPVPPVSPPGYTQPQPYGQPPATLPPQAYGQVAGYPPGYGYPPTPARRNSMPIYLALGLIGLVVVVVAGAVALSSTGGPHATPRASAVALATPTAAATTTPTSAPTPTTEIVFVTPAPTEVPTPFGTSWEDFSAYEDTQMATKIADNKAWNAANNGSTTYAAATKVKADDQADLAWLQAHPPMDCYQALHADLILYDNQDIKGMNDWFAGKYTTFNKVDQPALTVIWNRLGGEFDDADLACS